MIKSFTDLTAWQEAHCLALSIYRFTKAFPKTELFGITSQIRSASASVSANIAEGFGRYYFKDKQRFYYNSRGSLFETQNFVILSRDLGYINKEEYDMLIKNIEKAGKLINGLIRSAEKHN